MAVAATSRYNGVINRKTLTVSSKRQITIPQKFYQLLGFGNEAECILKDDELIIRPVKNNSGGEFAEQILADLINKGLSGDDLLKAFKKRQAEIRPAVEAMIAKSEDIAVGRAEYATYEDIFGSES